MRRSVNARDEDHIGWIERLYKSRLKYFAPAGLRAGLENGPDTRVRMALADGTQCFLNGGRMMRKVVVHDDSIHFTANLEPSLDAFKSGKGAANDLLRGFTISVNGNRT